MKRIVALLLIVPMLIIMVACTNFEPQSETEINTNPRFEYVCSEKVEDSGLLINYYRDIITDVVYIRLDSHHGFSVMFKADGTPYLWSELESEVMK